MIDIFKKYFISEIHFNKKKMLRKNVETVVNFQLKNFTVNYFNYVTFKYFKTIIIQSIYIQCLFLTKISKQNVE